jgi:hypothetical protein
MIMAKQNFLSRVQKTPKVKSIRQKIAKLKAQQKILGKKYRSLIKSESRRLSR